MKKIKAIRSDFKDKIQVGLINLEKILRQQLE